jgi:hypothetical protein
MPWRCGVLRSPDVLRSAGARVVCVRGRSFREGRMPWPCGALRSPDVLRSRAGGRWCTPLLPTRLSTGGAPGFHTDSEQPGTLPR